ncbi:MAG: hypothetical protein ACE365_00480 [Gammaproteobacteria bacterium]
MRDLLDYYSEVNSIRIHKPFFKKLIRDREVENTNFDIELVEEKPFSILSNKKSQPYNIVIDNLDAKVFRIIYSRKGNQSNNPIAWFFISRVIKDSIIIILLNPFEVYQNRHDRNFYKKRIESQIEPYKIEINELFGDIEQGIINLNDSDVFYTVVNSQTLDDQEEKIFCNTLESDYLSQLSSEDFDAVDAKKALEIIYHLLISIDLDQEETMRTEGYRILTQYLSRNIHKTLVFSKVNNDCQTIMVKIGESHQSKFITLENRASSSAKFFDEISEINFLGKSLLWKMNFYWGNNIDRLLYLQEWDFDIESNIFSCFVEQCSLCFATDSEKLKLFIEKLSLKSIQSAGVRSLSLLIDIIIQDLQSFLSFLEYEEVLENLSIIFNYALTKDQERIIFEQYFFFPKEDNSEEEDREIFSSITFPTITRFLESCLKKMNISSEYFSFNASFFSKILHWLEESTDCFTNILNQEILRILRQCDDQTKAFILSGVTNPSLFYPENLHHTQLISKREYKKNSDNKRAENNNKNIYRAKKKKKSKKSKKPRKCENSIEIIKRKLSHKNLNNIARERSGKIETLCDSFIRTINQDEFQYNINGLERSLLEEVNVSFPRLTIFELLALYGKRKFFSKIKYTTININEIILANALILALYNHKLDTALELAYLGANPDLSNLTNISIITYLVEKDFGHLGHLIIKEVLKNGASPLFSDSECYDIEPIWLAIYKNNINITRTLLFYTKYPINLRYTFPVNIEDGSKSVLFVTPEEITQIMYSNDSENRLSEVLREINYSDNTEVPQEIIEAAYLHLSRNARHASLLTEIPLRTEYYYNYNEYLFVSKLDNMMKLEDIWFTSQRVKNELNSLIECVNNIDINIIKQNELYAKFLLKDCVTLNSFRLLSAFVNLLDDINEPLFTYSFSDKNKNDQRIRGNLLDYFLYLQPRTDKLINSHTGNIFLTFFLLNSGAFHSEASNNEPQSLFRYYLIFQPKHYISQSALYLLLLYDINNGLIEDNYLQSIKSNFFDLEDSSFSLKEICAQNLFDNIVNIFCELISIESLVSCYETFLPYIIENLHPDSKDPNALNTLETIYTKKIELFSFSPCDNELALWSALYNNNLWSFKNILVNIEKDGCGRRISDMFEPLLGDNLLTFAARISTNVHFFDLLVEHDCPSSAPNILGYTALDYFLHNDNLESKDDISHVIDLFLIDPSNQTHIQANGSHRFEKIINDGESVSERVKNIYLERLFVTLDCQRDKFSIETLIEMKRCFPETEELFFNREEKSFSP